MGYYSSAERRFIHTGLYSDEALKLVQDIVHVFSSYNCSHRCTGKKHQIAHALHNFASIVHDASGEVVIAHAFDAIGRHEWSRGNRFAEGLKLFTDREVLQTIARGLKAIIAVGMPHVKMLKTKAVFYDVRFYDNGFFIHDGAPDPWRHQQIEMPAKDLAFIIAKLSGKGLSEFSKQHIEHMTGSPRDLATRELLDSAQHVLDSMVDEYVFEESCIKDKYIAERDRLLHELNEKQKAELSQLAARYDTREHELRESFPSLMCKL